MGSAGPEKLPANKLNNILVFADRQRVKGEKCQQRLETTMTNSIIRDHDNEASMSTSLDPTSKINKMMVRTTKAEGYLQFLALEFSI